MYRGGAGVHPLDGEDRVEDCAGSRDCLRNITKWGPTSVPAITITDTNPLRGVVDEFFDHWASWKVSQEVGGTIVSRRLGHYVFSYKPITKDGIPAALQGEAIQGINVPSRLRHRLERHGGKSDNHSFGQLCGHHRSVRPGPHGGVRRAEVLRWGTSKAHLSAVIICDERKPASVRRPEIGRRLSLLREAMSCTEAEYSGPRGMTKPFGAEYLWPVLRDPT